MVFTAPGGNCPTCVVSTSEGDYDPESDRIVSNVARQANGAASMCKVLDQIFGVEYGMTATHSFTDDQMILVADTVICAWLVRVLATLCQSPSSSCLALQRPSNAKRRQATFLPTPAWLLCFVCWHNRHKCDFYTKNGDTMTAGP